MPYLFYTVLAMTTNNQREKMPKEKKEYRVEIKSLFIVDVEATSPEEARKQVSEARHIGSSSGDGAFFYEHYDWQNAQVE